MKSAIKKFRFFALVIVWVFLFSSTQFSEAMADSVYVCCGDGTVHGFQSNGGSTILSDHWYGGGGVTFDNLGNLYITQPSSSYIWLLGATNQTRLFGYVDSVSGIAFSRTGKLISTIPSYAAILLLEFGGGQYFLNGNSTNSADYRNSPLAYPICLAVDNADIIYVSNGVYPWSSWLNSPYTNSILKFSKDFVYLGAFATNLNQPWGLAFDAAGNLFVSNTGTNGLRSNSILKYLPNGTRSTFANASSGLNQPCGIAFDSAGNLLVANAGAGNILKYDSSGTVSVFASGLNAPCSIAVYPGLKAYSATPVLFTNMSKLPDGNLQLGLVEPSGLNFSLLATTNLSLGVSNWANIGNFTETSPNQYQFTDSQATNSPSRFYRIKSQ